MRVKLSEICDVYDGPHATPPEADTGPIFLGIRNINESNQLDLTDVKRLSVSDFQKWTSRVIPQTDDIVFSYEATLNRYALIPDGFYGCLGRRLAIIRVKDPEIVNSHYLFYYFCSPSWKNFILKNKVVGSTVLRVSIEKFPDYEVELPDISVQNRVAFTLDQICSKIEANNSISSELDGMAKDLYDYWFVQFDFPDENGKPYKSNGGKMVWNEELKREIPAGWCVDALRSHITSSRGISYDTKALETAGIPMINLASFSVDSTYKPAGIKNYGGDYSKEKVLHPYDLVMCNTQQTAPDPQKDIIGKSLLVPDIFDGDVVSSHHVTSIKTDNDDLKYYFNATFKTSWFHKYVIGFASGTNILGLDFKGVENYLLPIPPASVLQKFADFSHNMEAQKSVIIRENEEFTSLRDFLLPMLMNGQVTVKDTSTNSTANG